MDQKISVIGRIELPFLGSTKREITDGAVCDEVVTMPSVILLVCKYAVNILVLL